MKPPIIILSVAICVVFSGSAYAALEEAPVEQQGGMTMPIDSAERSPSNIPDDVEKNLVNEPMARGQMLYENHCHVCHESEVHIREDHRAQNFVDIKYWVGRWSKELDVKWSAEEIDAVVHYLNDTYYHY